ncbi:MAG: M1 family metallopeptidase [Flavobacteriales bacterium]|nr:M1 family metallopeptidase [Flavobacteriales bacterium]
MKRLLSTLFALICLTTWAQQDYFQQEVNYTIEVALDDENHQLNGFIEMEYINNSPNALPFIWMHLWPNAYGDRNSALAKQQYRNGDLYMFYTMQKNLGGIDSLDFKVNNASAEWSFHSEHTDIAKLMLPMPLKSGERVTISTPFRVKIPSGVISRLGHVGESYQITQWYPKPAVYDKDGWHEMPYLNQGEFYSEYGSFDVSITLPRNYVLGATGDRYDSKAEEAFMDSLAIATAEKSEFPSNMEFPTSSSTMKTVKFKQDRVHDFAWFADKRWHVLKGEVELPHSRRKVTTWAMFTSREADLWQRSIEYLNDGTYYYSLWNGDYPYNHVTAVDGTISAGGGMEYPNITVIGGSGSDLSLETVIVHEVGHNWFYGILGSNERTTAWMDEGINSFNETRYFYTKYDTMKLGSTWLPQGIRERAGFADEPYRRQDELTYLISARLQQDQPMQCHSDELSQLNYGAIVYKKTAATFEYLKSYLGEDRFDQAMQAYFDAWKFKHPQPEDLQAILEKETGEDLTWFFEELVKTDGLIDFKAGKVKEVGGKLEVTVKNTGDISGPVEVTSFKDGRRVETTWTSSALAKGEKATLSLANTNVDKVIVDGGKTALDYNRKNNNSRTSGILKKVDPPSLKFFTRYEDPERTQIFWTPAVAWNNMNKWMLGLHFHNTSILPKDFEFALTPMYSISTGTLTGFGRLSYYKGPWEIELNTKTFRENDGFWGYNSDYVRSNFNINYTFDKEVNSGLSSKLTLGVGHYRVFREYDNTILFGDDITTPELLWPEFERFLPELNYHVDLDQKRVSHDLDVNLKALFEEELSSPMASLRYEGAFKYNRKGKKIKWMVFAAARDAGVNGLYPLTLAGVGPGQDIFADHLFLDRDRFKWPDNDNYFKTLLSRQITDTQGGMFLLQEYALNDWVTSARVEYQLPIGFPVSIWAAGGAYDNLFLGTEYAYSAGVTLELIQDVFEIHVPLAGNRMYTLQNTGPLDYLTFELNLAALSPQKLLRNLNF